MIELEISLSPACLVCCILHAIMPFLLYLTLGHALELVETLLSYNF